MAGLPLGTLLNAAAVVAGGLLGLLVGHRLPERVKQAVLAGIGLVVVVIALQAALTTTNAVIPLVSVVLGGALGEWLRVEDRVEVVGERLRARFAGEGDGGFVEGFVTLTLIAVVGPLTVLGTFQEGIDGNLDLLVVKTALDGLVAIPLAAVYGVGVAFAALGILAVQVPLTLVGGVVGDVLSDRMLVELEATGGVVIIGIGLRLLEIRRLPVASYLPALLIAPLIVALLGD